jgi:predicted RNA methylase
MKQFYLFVFCLWVMPGLSLPLHAQNGKDDSAPKAMKKSLAPYVGSPMNVVERMLELCEVDAKKIVYDLGCGDGRIVVTAAKKYQARAVGLELSPKLAQLATDKVVEAGVQHKVRVLQADIMDVSLAEADVVTLYLLSEANELLKPKLEQELRPGTCVVSHDFRIKGWQPVVVEAVKVYNRPHSIYVYKVKAQR